MQVFYFIRFFKNTVNLHTNIRVVITQEVRQVPIHYVLRIESVLALDKTKQNIGISTTKHRQRDLATKHHFTFTPATSTDSTANKSKIRKRCVSVLCYYEVRNCDIIIILQICNSSSSQQVPMMPNQLNRNGFIILYSCLIL